MVEGPEIVLAAAATQATAMVLHELATNAAKYGAAVDAARPGAVRWQRLSNAGVPTKLKLEWLETGGPTVAPPTETGYGTSVIRNLIPYELNGTVALTFGPSGVNCIIEVAVANDGVRLVDPGAGSKALRSLGRRRPLSLMAARRPGAAGAIVADAAGIAAQKRQGCLLEAGNVARRGRLEVCFKRSRTIDECTCRDTGAARTHR